MARREGGKGGPPTGSYGDGVDTFRTQPAFGLDLGQQLLGVAEQLARRGAVRGALEDGGELSLQLPRVKEECPVDVLAQRGELRLDDPRSGERRCREVVEAERPALVTRLV